MQSFTKLTSQLIPIPLKDVDTDMLIPAQYLTSTSTGGYGEALFKRLRDQDPKFPLNQAKYNGAQFIIAQSNFGCGSSREHAVWALLEYGIRAVIAPSFADIFAANASNNGLVLVQLPEAEIVKILTTVVDQPSCQTTIDLEQQQITLPDNTNYDFPFDPFAKECILNGYDNLDYLLAHGYQIKSWQQKNEEKVFVKL